MRNRSSIASLVMLFALLACNMPAGGPAVATETFTPIVPIASPIPSATPLPSETALPTATATPTIPIAWPSDKGVNCRFGYGTEWETIGALLVGQTATIQGKNSDSSWWYVVTQNDPGTPCWVASSVTLTAGNLANLPIIPQSIAQVTQVTLKLDPKDDTPPGCFGPPSPIEFKGSIHVNGPADVKWHFETEEDGSMGNHDLHFDFADTKSVDADYNPPFEDGSRWVRLVITQPNSKSAEQSYKIDCP
ncbi:MAG TPA: hypothetical protein VGJ22_07570 [Anaerolineales bacterium]|jgi:hypothetical protein